MKTLKDFEITDKNGTLRIKYTGDDPKMDKGVNILDSKFATYHLVKLLLNENTSNQQ